MIPISLSIQGIYSYQKKQVIDFQKLTDAHLFGIFGPTGSGKSSILEAITFALYKKSERLSERDNLKENLKNLRSTGFNIQLHFRAGKRLTDEYRFTVDYHPRRQGGVIVQRKEKRQDDQWLEDDQLDPEMIIGMSYENFRRTVIIPQDKFREFLELTPKDRTAMLKDIFNLHRFDLAHKVSRLDRENDLAVTALAARLGELGDADEDLITQKESAVKTAQAELSALEGQLSAASETEKEQARLADLTAQIADGRKAQAVLQAQALEFQEREKSLDHYQSAVVTFAALLEKEHEAAAQLTALSEALQQKQVEQSGLTKDLVEQDEALRKVAEIYEQRDALRQKARDAEKWAEKTGLDAELRTLNEALAAGLAQPAALESEIAQMVADRAIIQQRLDKQRQSLPRVEELMRARDWFQQQALLTEKSALVEMQLNELVSGEKEIITQIKKLGAQLAVLRGKKISVRADIGKLLEYAKGVRVDISAAESAVRDELFDLKTRSHLETIAATLADGEPCPVCGSREHPDIMAAHGTEEAIAAAESRLAENREAQAQLAVLTREIEQLCERQERQRTETAEKQVGLLALGEALSEHLKRFTWKKMFKYDDPTAVETALENYYRTSEALTGDNKMIDEMNLKIDQQRVRADELRSQVSTRQTAIARLQAQTELLESQVSEAHQTAFSGHTPSVLREMAQSLDEQSAEAESEYLRLQSQKDILEKKRHEGAAEIRGLEKQRQDGRATQKSVAQVLEERIAKSGFDSREAVEAILKMEIDTETERKAIRLFYDQVAALDHQLKAAEAERDARDYDPEIHSDARDAVESLTALLKEGQQNIGSLQSALALMREQWARRQRLQAELEKAQQRADNISILKKMFHGEGFVKFISQRFLEQIVLAANERFHQMTRRQLLLELQVDTASRRKNIHILVRDLLNGGERRSVKTLSGGQTFQASLCLALALADCVKEYARAPQNFFFLDEGFGALDGDSLRLVFESLKALRKENRIVGVISHVASLQQEINVYLTVRNDPEQGSLIAESWK